MAPAKVKVVDPALRVVELASGNPEEMTVSQPLSGQGGWLETGSWNLRVGTTAGPRCGVLVDPTPRRLPPCILKSVYGFYLVQWPHSIGPKERSSI